MTPKEELIELFTKFWDNNQVSLNMEVRSPIIECECAETNGKIILCPIHYVAMKENSHLQ